MEILFGMILLLQVFVSIQIMLTHRQVLQQLEKMEKRINGILEGAVVQEKGRKSDFNESCETAEEGVVLGQEEKEIRAGQCKGDAREALINEVLSEVFS